MPTIYKSLDYYWNQYKLSKEKNQSKPEVIFLGGLIMPQRQLEEDGKNVRDRYFYEKITLISPDGLEIHATRKILKLELDRWLLQKKDPSKRFDLYLNKKMKDDPKLCEHLKRNNVRYFNDQEREETKISFTDEGEMRQIGLDSETKYNFKLNEGEYAFILSKDRLYLAPKIMTHKGAIKHSSFLKGGPIKSAGLMKIDAEGKVISIKNHSGHYYPEKKEILECLIFLKKNLKAQDFNRLEIIEMVSKGWKMTVAKFLKDKLKISYFYDKWKEKRRSSMDWLKGHGKERNNERASQEVN